MAFLIGILLALVLGAVVFAMTRLPRLTAVIHEHGRMLLIGGVLVITLGVLSGCVLFVNGSETAGSVAMWAGAIVGGIAIAVSRAAAAALQVKAAEAVAKAGPPPGFGALQEAVFAMRYVRREAGSLVRLAGPWLLLLFLMAGGLVALAAAAPEKQALFVWLFLLVIGMSFTMVLGAATVAAAWMQMVIDGDRPAGLVVLPTRETWSVFWRLGLATFVGGGISNLLVGLLDQAPVIPGIHPTVLTEVGHGLAMLLIAMGAMPLAIALPAVAAGDRDVAGLRATVVRWGGGYSLGGLLAGAVFLAPGWIASLLLTGRDVPLPLLATLAALSLMLNTLALAAVSTYLARAYLAAKGRLPSQSLG